MSQSLSDAQPRHSPKPDSQIIAALNPVQRVAASTVDGPILMLAGPGSGKTRVLTYRIAYLLGEVGVDPHQILAVTFTNKAAREMKERVEKLLEQTQNEMGLAFGKSASVMTLGTFHAFCARVLRIDGEALGLSRNFTILDDGEQIDLIKSALSEGGHDPKQFSPRAVLSLISSAKSQLVNAQAYRAQAQTYFEEIAARVYVRYQEKLKQSQYVDFDDLINTTIELFEQKPDVLARYQDRYRYIMVDEYQDTNHAQYRLISFLAKKYRNICVVGDVNQSIYAFRKADITNILSFEEEYKDAQVIRLEQNYRSTQTILDTAQAIIAPNTQRREMKLWTDNGAGDLITVVETWNEMQEADYVVSEIERLQMRGAARPGEVAVLYRTNAQSRALEDMFVRRGLPYQIIGGTRFYERREVKDVLAYLRLVQNPADSLSFLRILNNTPTGKGIGQKTLQDTNSWANSLGLPPYEALQLLQSAEADALARQNRAKGQPHLLDADPWADSPDAPGIDLPPLSVSTKAKSALFDFINTIDAFRSLLSEKDVTLTGLFDYIMRKTGYDDSLKADGSQEGEERSLNVVQLREVTKEYGDLPAAIALDEFLQNVALVSDIDQFEDKKDAVTLITLHAAKGLEFKVVFMVGVEEGVLPHKRSLENMAEMEEERRLAYVGVTRAKRLLYLVYAQQRALFGSPLSSKVSRFVADIPPALVRGNGKNLVGMAQMGRTRVLGNTSGASIARSATGGATYGISPSQSRARAAQESVRNHTNGANGSDKKPEKPTTSAKTNFKAGDKVQHGTFGEGVVVSSQAVPNDEVVTVTFGSVGTKKLYASFAKLVKL